MRARARGDVNSFAIAISRMIRGITLTIPRNYETMLPIGRAKLINFEVSSQPFHRRNPPLSYREQGLVSRFYMHPGIPV
jgi:hypothetical protein